MSEERELNFPPPEALERLREEAERRLSPEEFDAYVNAPMSSTEIEGIWEMIDWFRRRYPTPLERLGYVRRAYARWKGKGRFSGV